MRVTRHATESYAIFYPQRGVADILREVELAVPIPADVAPGLLGRRGLRADMVPSRYLLHRERTGLFVIAPEADVVITFLRFYGREQHDTAARLWPGGDPVTCVATWAVMAPEPEPAPVAPEPAAVSVSVAQALVTPRSDRAAWQEAVRRSLRNGCRVPSGEMTLLGQQVAIVPYYRHARVCGVRVVPAWRAALDADAE